MCLLLEDFINQPTPYSNSKQFPFIELRSEEKGKEKGKFIHPSIYYWNRLSSRGTWAWWRLSQLSLDSRWSTSWTDCQPIRAHVDEHPFTVKKQINRIQWGPTCGVWFHNGCIAEESWRPLLGIGAIEIKLAWLQQETSLSTASPLVNKCLVSLTYVVTKDGFDSLLIRHCPIVLDADTKCPGQDFTININKKNGDWVMTISTLVCMFCLCCIGLLWVLRLPPTFQKHATVHWRHLIISSCESECKWLFVLMCAALG